MLMPRNVQSTLHIRMVFPRSSFFDLGTSFESFLVPRSWLSKDTDTDLISSPPPHQSLILPVALKVRWSASVHRSHSSAMVNGSRPSGLVCSSHPRSRGTGHKSTTTLGTPYGYSLNYGLLGSTKQPMRDRSMVVSIPAIAPV